MLERAKERILLLDSGKFGHSAPYRVTDLPGITQVITDSRLDAGWSKRLHHLGIGIQLVA
jgi:DeoR/GlpR family transcriptional regulator of sugar metabolism